MATKALPTSPSLRRPEADAKRAERAERTSVGGNGEEAVDEPEPTPAARD